MRMRTMKKFTTTTTTTTRRYVILLLVFFVLQEHSSTTTALLLSPSSLVRVGGWRRRRHRRRRGVVPKESMESSTITTEHNDDDDASSSIQQQQQQQQQSSLDTNINTLNAMRARAGLLRSSIQKQQLELQQLEREIICCASTSSSSSSSTTFTDSPLQRALTTFMTSANVASRKLGRVQHKVGRSNQQWKSVEHYVSKQTLTGARIVQGLLVNHDTRLRQLLVDPDTPTLVPHIPAILTRLDQLEPHVAQILEKVLNNNNKHLASIEPYLEDILERFDDIEPHLPWILTHIDALAPYTGLLLQHIDELLLYADDATTDDVSDDDDRYALASQLLPYLEYYVSKLHVIGPHLPLLRPHVPLLLKHNRIGNISPHIDRLFALGYQDLSASANMDVLLFWVGWTLRIPKLPGLFFKLPGSPRIVSLLANRLPKRFVRGYCRGVTCNVDNDYGQQWNKLRKE